MPAPKYRTNKLPLIIFWAEMFAYLAFEFKTQPLLVSINLSCQSANNEIVGI